MPDSATVHEVSPPIADRRPVTLTAHGDDRVDDYYWLRERDDPEVIAYLKAENEYAEAALAPQAALRERIYGEIGARIQQTDESAPVAHGPFEYYSRTVEGLDYVVHCRRPRGGGEEQVLLDVNDVASGLAYCAITDFEVSPDRRILAYSVDPTGGEISTLRFRDLDTGADMPDLVEGTYYGLAWGSDSRTVLYVRPDSAIRPWQVWRHRLGDPQSRDTLVFEDPDERFFVDVARSRSGRYLLIGTSSKTTSEVWFVEADDRDGRPRVVEPRADGLDYSAEHYVAPDGSDRFFVLSNAGGAVNFSLFSAPASTPGREHWTEVLPEQTDARIESVHAFARHAVVAERADAARRLRVIPIAGGPSRFVEVGHAVVTFWVGENPEFDTDIVRVGYTSLSIPPTDCDLDLGSGATTIVKRQPVLGGYEPDDYVTAREWATAGDGTRIPITLVHRRDATLDGTAPALLYGYGSYETPTEPTFRPTRVSLLERGVVYAIAHVRGGGDLGRRWYEEGRLGNKHNTFTDFVACAEHLLARGYAAPGRLAARGGSAGGLLMGAVTNLRPDLFAAVVAEVPFVDVLTTMQDEKIPLTVTEWEEWGDPADPVTYQHMKSYSPYDNVAPRAYPDLLVTGGLHDPRVQYWEPAKWVAKLRAHDTGGGRIVLRTRMGAGHGGPSARYEAWRDEALVLAFVLDAVEAGG